MKRFVMVLFVGATSLFISGCGVYMAFTAPPPVDVTAFDEQKLPRPYLIERLGMPKGSTIHDDGTIEDVYEFYEGQSQGWSKGRGVLHVVGDVLTLALWEIVATPFEWAARGDKITAVAEFDKNQQLVSFKVIGRQTKPLEKIHSQQNGT
jgi:hypothetical protein